MRPGPNSPQRSRILWPCAATIIIALLAILGSAQSRKGKEEPKDAAQPALGVQLISVNGCPELHVDGRPFFVHAAEFSYFRIPRDLWSDSLDRYRDLGINTIDIRIPWNWHEPAEGAFDFDGRTNPRRDLRALLRMIAEKGFRLIARPGPIIGNEWRNGGFPDWLLSRPEYRMTAMDRLAGLSPLPASGDAASAANMRYATEWLTAVARELAPYSPSNTMTLPEESADDDKPKERKISGPLLFVLLEDSAGMNPANFPASEYWKYIAAIRDALLAGGIKPGFAGAFAVSASHAENGFGHSDADPAVGVAGEWFLEPFDRTRNASAQSAGVRLLDSDAETLALLAQSLRTQPEFPPLVGGFQAGWFAPADDTNAPVSEPANTLLASRWLLGQGITGIEYAPLQDSLTPPGYQTAKANREFRWDAALGVNGARQPRARAVVRNARMLTTWSEFLATSHPRAEIGIVDIRDLSHSADSSPDTGTAAQISRQFSIMLRQIERITSFGGYSAELVDPEHESVDMLLRDPLLMLVIPAPMRGMNLLSVKAQNALLDYIRRGGTLVCDPERPAGTAFDLALGGAAPENFGEGLRATKLGEGKLLEWSIDAFSWAALNESFAANLARPEASWASKQLQAIIAAAGGLTPIVSFKDHPAALLVSELAANASAGALGAPPPACAEHPRCGAGLLSVTNWSGDDSVRDTLAIVPPTASARAPSDDDLISLPVEIPPRESLLLPVNIPLCPEDAAASCREQIVAAGAEFLGATRSGKTLDLLFYAPAKATVLVKLNSPPTSVELPVQILTSQNDTPMFPERSLEGKFDEGTHIFTVELPRGAAPDFFRDVRLHLTYTPGAPERPKPAKHRAHDFRYSIADAVRLPLGRGSLATEPPLISLDPDGNGRLVVQAESQSDSWITVQAVVDGEAHGSERLHLEDHREQLLTVKLLASGPAKSPPDPKTPDPESNALQPGVLSFTGDRNIDKKSPLTFLMANGDDPVGYEYDFERSGSKNRVLENKNMRLILLPDAGGEIAALVEKTTGANLTTTVGGLRDLIRLSDGKLIDPTFNLPYQARWITENGHPMISLEATLPEDAPVAGRIKKDVRLETKDGRETVEVHYVFIANPSESKSNPAEGQATGAGSAESVTAGKTFVTAFSVAALADPPERTQFCWFASPLPESAGPNSASANPTAPAVNPTANPAGNPGANPAASPVDRGHCSPFVASGAPISLPPEAKRVEVRTAGQPTLAMEWDAGRVTIEQKQFSARLLLDFPTGGATGNDGGVRLRYTILHAP